MIVAAIAAEYNPFHNGHARHIAETRAAGATHVAAIMSGNFTQRGTAAVAEKRVRAEAALRGGADLVLELPMRFVCSEDCKGICYVCGANRNIAPCTCQEGGERQNPFSALSELLTEDEEV